MRELEESKRLLYVERVNCERALKLKKIAELQVRRKDFDSSARDMCVSHGGQSEARRLRLPGTCERRKRRRSRWCRKGVRCVVRCYLTVNVAACDSLPHSSQVKRQDWLTKQEKVEAKLARAEEAHAINIEGIPAVQEEVASHKARQRKVTGDTFSF